MKGLHIGTMTSHYVRAAMRTLVLICHQPQESVYIKRLSAASAAMMRVCIWVLGLRKEQHLANQVGSFCGRTKQIRRNKLYLGI